MVGGLGVSIRVPHLVVRCRHEVSEAERHLDDPSPGEVELFDNVATDVADLDLEGTRQHGLSVEIDADEWQEEIAGGGEGMRKISYVYTSTTIPYLFDESSFPRRLSEQFSHCMLLVKLLMNLAGSL